MRTILYIVRKEFAQIFRNKTMLPIIFALPVVQLLVLVYAANLDMKEVKMIVLDQDLSQTSRSLINSFEGSPFFSIQGHTFSLEEAMGQLKLNKADLIVSIPSGFEYKLFSKGKTEIQLLINAINITTAGLTNAYASSIISDYNKDIIANNIHIVSPASNFNINMGYSFWYNPEMNYKIYMLPGILVILVTIIGMFLSALNLVREKEMGTIEQINVTPIRKYEFIAGKLLPFWLIALFELAFGLFIGKLLFNMPMIGSLPLLFLVACIYLLLALGLCLLVSTVSKTQQQVMFVTFFVFLTFVMMSGIFTPTESMPDWAQKLNIINPLAYLMKVIRMILLKGSGFNDIKREFFSLLVYAVIAISLAIWRYRKTA